MNGEKYGWVLLAARFLFLALKVLDEEGGTVRYQTAMAHADTCWAMAGKTWR
jgi:hypothetical protein